MQTLDSCMRGLSFFCQILQQKIGGVEDRHQGEGVFLEPQLMEAILQIYLNQVIQAVTFFIPDGRRSLNLWKSHLNHPKKVTKNHLEIVFNLCRRMLHRS